LRSRSYSDLHMRKAGEFRYKDAFHFGTRQFHLTLSWCQLRNLKLTTTQLSFFLHFKSPSNKCIAVIMHISIFVTLLLVSSVGLVSSLPSTDYSTHQTDRQIASHFKKILSPEAQVFLPTDSNFSTETIQAWNANNAPTYRLSVKPATEVDVQEIVSSQSTRGVGTVPQSVSDSRSWQC